METDVKLQKPFSYALWPIIVLAIIMVLAMIGLIVYKVMKKRMRKKPPVVCENKAKDSHHTKLKYLKELDSILADLNAEIISARIAYQRTSLCIRKFTYDMTGVKVQNYTLDEIKVLQVPTLENLVSEYYVPEFSKDTTGDVIASIEKTRRAIEEWNLLIGGQYLQE
jgi:hypothetical protein